MRRFGSLKELFKLIWRDPSSNEEVELVPSSSATYSASTTVELPNDDATTQELVGVGATQTLQNKSLDADSTHLVDGTDATKRAAVDVSGITTATTRTVTVPDADVTLVNTSNGLVGESNLTTDAVTTVKILNGSVTTDKLDDDAVTTTKILDENVTADKIADDAVTTNKILDENVTADKIADDAVTTNKILDENVTTDKLADLSVTEGKLANLAVTNDKVSNTAAIAYSKLNLTGAIVDADIEATASIARTKVASGSNNHVIINDGSGDLSSEATLAKSRGGTGADNSSVTFPSTGTIVTRDATETLENKTFADPIGLQELSTVPSNPSAGTKKLYAKDDGLLYTLNSAGEEVPVGSGTGAGLKNYVANPDLEVNLADWSVTGDATLSRITSGQLEGKGSLRITSTGTSSRFVVTGAVDPIDLAYSGVLLDAHATIRVTPASTYTEGNHVVEVYNETDAAVVGGTALPLKEGIHFYNFPFAPDSSKTYTIRVRDVDGASGDLVDVDLVRIGPNPQLTVPLATETVPGLVLKPMSVQDLDWRDQGAQPGSKWAKALNVPENRKQLVGGARTNFGFSTGMSNFNKWFGGVLGPDGKIYGIPFNSANVLVIDPVVGTMTRTNFGFSTGMSNSSKWVGGVLGPDGKIYGMPYNSADVLVIDPVAETMTRTNFGFSTGMSNSSKWFGGVLGPDGKIYGIPRNSADVLVIGTFKRSFSEDVLLSGYLNKF